MTCKECKKKDAEIAWLKAEYKELYCFPDSVGECDNDCAECQRIALTEARLRRTGEKRRSPEAPADKKED